MRIPVRYGPKGNRSWIIHASPTSKRTCKPDRVLIRALRKAHEAQRTATHAHVKASSYERRRRRLAFLAPDIQVAILEGRQPQILTLESLIHGDLPLAWSDQRALFGFS